MNRSIAMFLVLAGCWPPPPPLPEPEPDASSSTTVQLAEVMCDANGGVAADDPCCVVHQCLRDAGDEACAMQVECNALVEPSTVCGDQVCGPLECSSCPGGPGATP